MVFKGTFCINLYLNGNSFLFLALEIMISSSGFKISEISTAIIPPSDTPITENRLDVSVCFDNLKA